MRVLEQYTIIKTALLLALLMSLCVLNFYIFIRRRGSKLYIGVHISSFMGLSGTFCYLMDTVILGLPFENYFKWAGRIFTALCLLVLAITCFALIFARKRAFHSLRWSPDLKSVFTSIEDLVLIVDYKGYIVEVNHPKKLEAMLGVNCETIDSLKGRLINKASENSYKDINTKLARLDINDKFEVHILEEDNYYLLSITPIASGSNSYPGSILTFHSITEKKKSEYQIMSHNEYLEKANMKLSSYVKISNILEIEKERLGILEHVQRDLINRIQKAIVYVRNIQKNTYESIPVYQKDIRNLADMLREVYKDIRRSVQSIYEEKRG